jgi:hypothetical protein
VVDSTTVIFMRNPPREDFAPKTEYHRNVS